MTEAPDPQAQAAEAVRSGGLQAGFRTVFGDAQFLAGQSFMICATVIGVYLAAQQGFTKALEFDNLKSEMDGYNLRAALRSELVGNVERMHGLIKTVRDTGYMPESAHEWPRLQTHLWESARIQPELFETPAPVLAAMSDFYAEIPALLNLVKTNMMKWEVSIERFKAQLHKIEDEALPQMEASLAQSRAMAIEYYAESQLIDLVPPPG